MRNPRLEGVCRAERRKEAENGFKSGGKQPRVLKEGAFSRQILTNVNKNR